jgi:hypothetical protein
MPSPVSPLASGIDVAPGILLMPRRALRAVNDLVLHVHNRSVRRHQLFFNDLPLAAWAIPQPPNWLEVVNEPQSEPELQEMQEAIGGGRPVGNPDWAATWPALCNYQWSAQVVQKDTGCDLRGAKSEITPGVISHM